MNYPTLIGSAKRNEGLRVAAYQDTKGIWTIGYGRNLQAIRITEQQAGEWLEEDMLAAIRDAQQFPEYVCLIGDARENAFIEMVFNMGAKKVNEFKKMLAAIAQDDWTIAAHEMLNSEWAKEVGARATRLAQMMVSGEFPQT